MERIEHPVNCLLVIVSNYTTASRVLLILSAEVGAVV